MDLNCKNRISGTFSGKESKVLQIDGLENLQVLAHRGPHKQAKCFFRMSLYTCD